MRREICPRCDSSRPVQQTVNDRFRAWDPAGQVFEVTLQEPIWNCPVCNMSWEGPDGFAAKEKAYQEALQKRHASPAADV
jgi:hypothetical protein